MAGNVRVIYSIGSKFAGGVSARTAYQAVRGLYRHGLLHRLAVRCLSPHGDPLRENPRVGLPGRALRKLASLDPSGWLWHLQAVLYDAWSCPATWSPPTCSTSGATTACVPCNGPKRWAW